MFAKFMALKTVDKLLILLVVLGVLHYVGFTPEVVQEKLGIQQKENRPLQNLTVEQYASEYLRNKDYDMRPVRELTGCKVSGMLKPLRGYHSGTEAICVCEVPGMDVEVFVTFANEDEGMMVADYVKHHPDRELLLKVSATIDDPMFFAMDFSDAKLVR